MERTIIYVFGPKRLASLYVSGNEMALEENGGWVKIGQTTENDDNVDKWDSAMKRINQETHTGIPEVCQLYDVFEYPKQKGNADDYVRRLLAEGLYELKTSKKENKNLEKNAIKAGREFVYGVSRSQIHNAFAVYERNLILECSNEIEKLKNLINFIKNNNSDSDDESNEVTLGINLDFPSERNNKIWREVKSKINEKIDNNITNQKDRHYISIKSKHSNQEFKCCYFCQMGIRSGIISVVFETYGGEADRDNVNAYLDNNNELRKSIPNIALKQGIKNKEKWAWNVSDTLNKSDKDLIEWFVKTFFSMYHIFEKYDPKTNYISK